MRRAENTGERALMTQNPTRLTRLLFSASRGIHALDGVVYSVADNRFSRRLIEAVKQSPTTQTELAVSVSIQPPHLSTYLRGVTFGESVRTRALRLAALVGVPPAAAVVPADVPVEDEAGFLEFEPDHAVIMDRSIGRATVADERDPANRMTFAAFRKKHGSRGDKWLLSTRRRTFTEDGWRVYLATKTEGAR